MYPSLIQSENLCWSTICLEEQYAHVPGVEYLDMEIGGEKHRFAQNAQAPSVLPDMLKDLVSLNITLVHDACCKTWNRGWL